MFSLEGHTTCRQGRSQALHSRCLAELLLRVSPGPGEADTTYSQGSSNWHFPKPQAPLKILPHQETPLETQSRTTAVAPSPRSLGTRALWGAAQHSSPLKPEDERPKAMAQKPAPARGQGAVRTHTSPPVLTEDKANRTVTRVQKTVCPSVFHISKFLH